MRQSKWIVGGLIMKIPNSINKKMGMNPTTSITYDNNGYPHAAGAAPRQLVREMWMPLMVEKYVYALQIAK